DVGHQALLEVAPGGSAVGVAKFGEGFADFTQNVYCSADVVGRGGMERRKGLRISLSSRAASSSSVLMLERAAAAATSAVLVWSTHWVASGLTCHTSAKRPQERRTMALADAS